MRTMSLPVTEILDELGQVLANRPSAVLRAPPGAGKTTCVPLFLKDADWLQNRKIVMMAPRRLAARAAASRMSRMLGEKVGHTVGYRVRMDTKVGPGTRIEVVTEGVLIRMLQSDPSLEGVGLVIFDEFHERSLDDDLGLALCLDIQGVLNADLKVLVMSATMETKPVANMLGQAPVIDAKGRTHPVETRYVGAHMPSGAMAEVTRTILSAVTDETGNILVFLPGASEIRQVARELKNADLGPKWMVAPLLGSLNPTEQDIAISPPPNGFRKIVLATAIAETSLTIEGISVVVDCGLQRISRFDVRSGMSRLVTLPVSRASADQRRGRAGRLGPGICLRLWSAAMDKALIADRPPEIMEADLCGLALELASWGIRHPGDLKWLNPPPKGAYNTACALLQALNALDNNNTITPHGRDMAAMPVHPRLAHMLLMAGDIGQFRAACDLAALLTEGDPLRFPSGQSDADLQLRFDVIQSRRRNKTSTHSWLAVNGGICKGILMMADRLYRQLTARQGHRKSNTKLSIGQLLAWAYPDRIARRRGERGRYIMTGGQGVRLNPAEPLSAETFIVAVETDGQRSDARIFRAAAYCEALLKDQFAHQLEWQADIRWDSRRQAVTAQRVLRMGAMTIRKTPLHQPDEQRVLTALMSGIAQHGVAILPWSKALRSWQSRVNFLHTQFDDKNQWPDVSDPSLAKDLKNWLSPFLSGIISLRGLTRVDLRGALFSLLSYDQHQRLDILAPTHWKVPSGSRIPIDYTGKVPVLAVRLQEMFGLEQTPAIAGGRQSLLIHLLSPASRPVQVTQDLAGFWKNSYHDVKKELKGRYPKHYWPDDPLKAKATSKAKPRGNKPEGPRSCVAKGLQ